VQSDQQQTTLQQERSKTGADLTITYRDFTRFATAANCQITPDFGSLRYACQAVWHDFAADQQDTLVACSNLGNVTLHHDRRTAVVGQGLDDGAKVHCIFLHPEDTNAAHAIQWL